MNTKHTPGPWSINDQQCSELLIQRQHKIIARVQSDNVRDVRYYDACLVAAAPDLLAALEIVANLTGFGPDDPYGIIVRAAIAKAKVE